MLKVGINTKTDKEQRQLCSNKRRMLLGYAWRAKKMGRGMFNGEIKRTRAKRAKGTLGRHIYGKDETSLRAPSARDNHSGWIRLEKKRHIRFQKMRIWNFNGDHSPNSN